MDDSNRDLVMDSHRDFYAFINHDMDNLYDYGYFLGCFYDKDYNDYKI